MTDKLEIKGQELEEWIRSLGDNETIKVIKVFITASDHITRCYISLHAQKKNEIYTLG